MAVAFVRSLFEDKLLEDDRDPLCEFAIPGADGTFGLFAPKWEPWKQLAALIALQIPLQCAFAAINYAFIIKRRGTPFAYLLGWGFVIPAACYIPYALLEFLDVRHKPVKLGASNVASVVVFRTIEAMMGTPPTTVVETSMQHYLAYYTTVVPFSWDEKTKSRRRVTLYELANSLFWLVLVFHALSIHLSFLIAHDYKPFENDPVELDEYHFNLDLFAPKHLANAYLQALLTFFVLYFGFEASAFSQRLQGYYTIPIFRNPLFMSRTPTEFWTKRWNTMIHRSLKYGVFLPAQKYMSPKMALVLAFIGSGVFHEQAWSVVFYHQEHLYDEDGHCHGCFVPVVGKLTAFFLFTGFVMLLERPVGELPVVRWLSQRLPTVVVSTLLVLVHLPFAHWYMGEWIVGGYFNDFRLMVWYIRRV